MADQNQMNETDYLALNHDQLTEKLSQLDKEAHIITQEIGRFRTTLNALLAGNIIDRLLKRREITELQNKIQEARIKYQKIYSSYSQLTTLMGEEKNLKHKISDTKADTDVSIPIEPLDEESKKPDTPTHKQKNVLSDVEFSKENIKKYFSEEHLCSLDMNQYIQLLQHFHGYMVTNVIRQGVRDHAEFYYHQEGLGEFTDQFKMVLRNGRLTSFIIDALKNDGNNSAMNALLEKEIELTQANNKEEVLTRLKAYISCSKKEELHNRYADKLAVHFAVQEVADRRYGGEKNNEIFVAFPSLYIASQHHFNGVSLTEGTPDIASDLSVWTKDAKGMDLNAGIVFIPANQQVDRETGSKYELDQNIKPIVNEHDIQAILRFVQSPEFVAIAKRAKQILAGLDQTYIHFYDWNEQKNYQFPNRQEKDAFLQKKLKVLCDEISEKFGINNPILQTVVLDYRHLDFQLNSANKSPSEKEEFIKHCLLRHELLFKKSTQTISSKEYWTQYFLDHPEQKPSKIIFYEEQTPTEALFAWQYKNQFNLTAQNGHHFGFDENIPPLPGDITLQNIDQFEILAQRIIEQYFS